MTTGEKENDRPEAEADEGSIPESPASEILQEAEGSLEDAPASEPDELETLRAENESLRDEFLRAKAEAENARKRAQTEITNARRFAVEGFAGELLNVRDSLDLARAVDLNEGDSVVERVVEGV